MLLVCTVSIFHKVGSQISHRKTSSEHSTQGWGSPSNILSSWAIDYDCRRKQVRPPTPKEWDGSTHDPLPELFPDVLRRRFIVIIRNHLVQAGNKVHLFGLHKSAPHHETRDPEQDRGEHQRDVKCDEGRRVPVAPKEDGEAAKEEDQGDHDETVPCRVGLEGGFVWEEVSVKTLSVPTSSEP